MTLAAQAFQRSLAVLAFVALGGCGADAEELWRVTSPDSRVDAVFVQYSGGGATVGFYYNLFIVPHGTRPEKGYECLLADNIGTVSAVWSEPKRVEIRYDQARIFKFSNFWHTKQIDNFNYVVELKLVPTGASQLGDRSNEP